MDARPLRSEFPLNPLPRQTMNFVRRIAVSGAVFLWVLAIHSGVFAAQCGGLPKGWKPAESQVGNSSAEVLHLGQSDRPAAPMPAPCQCTGASCQPAAPSPAPERGVVWSVSADAFLDRPTRLKSVRSASEFPASVNSTLRYEVVLGVFRPPCGV